MKRKTAYSVFGLALGTACAATAAAQTEPDRTALPIPEPQIPHSTVLDVRNATPPPRFEVKAPAGAPNVLIVLIDDMGFGQSSAFGGPINMPTADAWPTTASGTTVPHHGPVLADPGGAAHRPQSPHEQHGLDHGDRHGLPGQHRPASRQRGPAGDDAAVQRLLPPPPSARTTRPPPGKSALPARPTAGRPAAASTSSTASWAARRTSGRRPSMTA